MAETAIDDLFARALQGDYEDEAPWEAVRELHRLGTRQVFDKAAQWTDSAEPLMRARGIDVLAQLGKTWEHPSNCFPQESYEVVVKALQGEREVQPLTSAISAFGPPWESSSGDTDRRVSPASLGRGQVRRSRGIGKIL